MKDILIFHGNKSDIGFSSRKPTRGPEWELVQNFLEFKVNKLTRLKRQNINYAVFIEPLLDTGFPDIVIAEYKPSSFDDWNKTRNSLKITDLKVFQHILKFGGSDSETIENMLGISNKPLLTTLERLLDAGLIIRRSKQWKARDHRRTLGVKKIVAIEAKISNWVAAFNQAQLNKWFSSESYVLTNTQNPTARTLSRSKEIGVGIYILSNNNLRKINNSQTIPFPSCFGSLLFNEWIGRFLNE